MYFKFITDSLNKTPSFQFFVLIFTIRNILIANDLGNLLGFSFGAGIESFGSFLISSFFLLPFFFLPKLLFGIE